MQPMLMLTQVHAFVTAQRDALTGSMEIALYMLFAVERFGVRMNSSGPYHTKTKLWIPYVRKYQPVYMSLTYGRSPYDTEHSLHSVCLNTHRSLRMALYIRKNQPVCFEAYGTRDSSLRMYGLSP